MLVLSHFDVPEQEAVAFTVEVQAALVAFAARPGFLRGRVGRAADEPTAWVLTTEWADVGGYRRSLSAYDVKVATAGLFARARPEPSAFEILVACDQARPPVAAPSRRAVAGGP